MSHVRAALRQIQVVEEAPVPKQHLRPRALDMEAVGLAGRSAEVASDQETFLLIP
jgi:hypothetical protein